VVQRLDVPGTPYATKDGKFIVIVDNQKHKLHIYQVGSPVRGSF